MSTEQGAAGMVTGAINMAPTLDKVTFWGRTRGTRVADDHFLLLTQRVLEAQSLRKGGRDASHFLLLVFYSWSSPKWGEAGWLCQGQNISPHTIYNSTSPVRWDLSHYCKLCKPSSPELTALEVKKVETMQQQLQLVARKKPKRPLANCDKSWVIHFRSFCLCLFLIRQIPTQRHVRCLPVFCFQ